MPLLSWASRVLSSSLEHLEVWMCCLSPELPWLWEMAGWPRWRILHFLDWASSKGLCSPWYCWRGPSWCLQSMLPEVMSMIIAITRHDVSIHVPWCYQGPCHCSWSMLLPETYWCLWSMLPLGSCWCLWSMLLPEIMLIFLPHSTTREHMSVAWAAIRGHVGACGSRCHLRPCRCWWPYYSQRICGCLWPRLSPKVMCIPMVHAATGNHVLVFMFPLAVNGHVSFFCISINGWRLIIENETLKVFVTPSPLPPPPPKRNSLNRKPLKRVLKNCDKDADM